MDPYAELTISVDVNSAGMPRYRVEFDVGETAMIQGEGYSIEDAVRDALGKVKVGREEEPS